MTTPVWPPLLNHLVERDSFQFRPSDPPLRSEFDYGPARTRRRFTRNNSYLNFTVVLDTNEFESFRAFYLDDLENGTNWFSMPIWYGGLYLPHNVRFVEPYAMSYHAFRHVKVSAKIEVKRLTAWDGATAYFVGTYGDESLAAIDDQLQVIVNTDWPGITEDY